MDDTRHLQARIASLVHRIDSHNEGAQTTQDHSSHYSSGQEHFLAEPHHTAAYGAYHNRGWTSQPALHRHKSLIMSYPPISTSATVGTSIPIDSPSQSDWIIRSGRNLQLIHKSIYDKLPGERLSTIDRTREEKVDERGNPEKTLLHNHLRAAGTRSSSTPPARPVQQIYVANIRFLVADDGSKLIRTEDENNKIYATPKRANVAGVTFHRSKHGNLYRTGLINTQRQGCMSKIQEPCNYFSSTGSCAKGPACRYTHDPSKVAMCKIFLQKGECPAGNYCDLSHVPIPERVPACVHFHRGNCNNSECQYSHIPVSPGAPVCKVFALNGFCPDGAKCGERHVHECPEYANKGSCRANNCRLPHVDRAGLLRKVAAGHSEDDDAMVMSDISSENEYDSDDVDSDELDGKLFRPDRGNSPGLSQQREFVRL